MDAPLLLSRLFIAQIGRAPLARAMDSMGLQGVGGVHQALHCALAIALLALGDEALGEFQIIENGACVGEIAEGLVVLEEVIMTKGGVGDDEGLHRRRIALHDIGNAGAGIDDDLIGQTHEPLAIHHLVLGIVFAEGPVVVKDRHARRRIGVEHLFGGDDLDLVGIDI